MRHPGAGAGRIGKVAAFAGVGGGDQHEAAGIAYVGIGACDHDLAVLDGLAQGFQHGAGEFRELVHEQHAVVGEADFARFRAAPAADDGGHRGGVMRFAERPDAGDAAFVQQARQRMDHRGFQRLGGAQRRQDARQTGGQHRLARAGRTDHQDMVAACRGNFQRTFGAFLPLHVAEIAGCIRGVDFAGVCRGQDRAGR